MSSEACGVSPDSKSFIEDAIQYVFNTVSSEIWQLLLTNVEAWEIFVAEAELSRDEADALHEGLNKLNTDMAVEDKDMIQKDQLYRKKFLNEFPRVKRELEEYIRKFHTLADEVDKVHRDCTISNVVATSTSAVSGFLTILGLGLAPVTAGVSLALSATGMGLGAAAAVTSVSTSIVEHTSEFSAKVKASRLASTDLEKWVIVIKSLFYSLHDIASLPKDCRQVIENIGRNISAFKLAKANPRLVADAKCLMTSGRISVQRGKQVQKAFGGTVLAMTKGARMMAMATAGVSLLMDVVSLVKESVHLHEGAKAKSAEELRRQAQELQRMLEELTQIHERLQQGLILRPPEQCREQGHVVDKGMEVPC